MRPLESAFLPRQPPGPLYCDSRFLSSRIAQLRHAYIYEKGPVSRGLSHSPGWTRTNNPPVNSRPGAGRLRLTAHG